MKTDETQKGETMRKKHFLKNILISLCIFSLIAISVTLGYVLWKQQSLLREKTFSLETQKETISNLTAENQTLKDSLTDKEAYIAEFDSVLFDSKGEDPNTENPSASNSQEEDPSGTLYKKKYKNLYVSKEQKDNTKGKIVYLTFDDGPSHNTPKVLDILDDYGIKATFFVVKTEEESFMKYYKEIVDRGHTIAIHTASHNYKKIYSSVDAYLEDFNEIYTLVYEQTGVKATLFRYPGGSTNCKSYKAGEDIMTEMERRGFTYYDWNVSSGDGGNQATRSTIYDWVTGNAKNKSRSVVLMHDSGGKAETVAALPSIIETLQQQGCEFRPLDETCTPVQFGK